LKTLFKTFLKTFVNRTDIRQIAETPPITPLTFPILAQTSPPPSTFLHHFFQNGFIYPKNRILSKMTAMEIDEEYDYEAMYKLQLQENANMKEEIEKLKTENEQLKKEVAETFEALTELQEENMKLNNEA
jgi:hypothetical protein